MVVIVRKKDGTVKRSDEKVCGKCERLLPENQFYKRGPNGRQAWCKDCMKKRAKKAKKEVKVEKEIRTSTMIEDEYNRRERERMVEVRTARMMFLSAYVKVKEIDPDFVGKLGDLIGPAV